MREVTAEEASDNWTVRVNGQEILDTPTFQRNRDERADLNEADENLNRGKKGIFKRAFMRDSLDYPTFLRAKAD